MLTRSACLLIRQRVFDGCTGSRIVKCPTPPGARVCQAKSTEAWTPGSLAPNRPTSARPGGPHARPRPRWLHCARSGAQCPGAVAACVACAGSTALDPGPCDPRTTGRGTTTANDARPARPVNAPGHHARPRHPIEATPGPTSKLSDAIKTGLSEQEDPLLPRKQSGIRVGDVLTCPHTPRDSSGEWAENMENSHVFNTLNHAGMPHDRRHAPKVTEVHAKGRRAGECWSTRRNLRPLVRR